MRNSSNAMAELKSLLEARAPLYAQADHTADTSDRSVVETVQTLVRAVGGPSIAELATSEP